MRHKLIRSEEKWGTYGKNQDQPLSFILIKDISDTHLSNIIIWVTKYKTIYSDEILELMNNEQDYRHKHYINIPEHYN